MKINPTEIIGDFYNLRLNPATRDWECAQLKSVKTMIVGGAKCDDQIAKFDMVATKTKPY